MDARFEAVRATITADNLYNHGRGDPGGFEEARTLFEFSAEAGIPNAQFYFARMNQYGHGGPRDFSVAWEYYQAAAENGDPRAWNNLGYMLAYGQGRPVDNFAAYEHYLEAAYRGMSMGMYNVAQNLRKGRGVEAPDWNAAAKWYQLCVQAYPRYEEAWNQLGRIFEEGGYGLERNPIAAIDCFVRADRLGDRYGAYNLGRQYRDGIDDFPRNLKLAETAFVRAGRRGYSRAWDAAGDLYFYPKETLTPKRAKRALRYYLLANEAGWEEAVGELAWLYRFGPDNVRNPETAIPFLERYAEEQQKGWGYRVLGACYWDGIGVETDKEQAVAYYRLGAKLGDGKSARRLGAALVRGNGTEQNFEEARQWLEVALENERFAAADDLGFLYEKGKGVEKDLERAAEYYQIGADQNFTYSLFCLGAFHLKELIANADPAYGVTLMEGAANAGDKDAIKWMARIYKEGLGGVTPDPVQADAWTEKLSE